MYGNRKVGKKLVSITKWDGALYPKRTPIHGQYVDLKPLSPEAHSAELYAASAAEGSEERFRYLAEYPPRDFNDLNSWAQQAAKGDDPLFYAVVDRATGRVEGRQALMRIDNANGVIEIGSILWGPRLARTRGATEAFFLFAEHVFNLGYLRLEWKCNNLNVPSKHAAERFGFTYEGTFRKHMFIKGSNRDTSWYSILDTEWEVLRTRFERWLDPSNFDVRGIQRESLRQIC